MQTITATYENGVLKLSRPLPIPAHSEVRVTIELIDTEQGMDQRQAALRALEELWKANAIDSDGDRLTREQLHERR